MYILTTEGEGYLKSGLPERKLIEKLAKGPMDMKDVMIFPKASIAVNWAKKNGWIKIKEGKVRLTNEGENSLPEDYKFHTALEEVQKGRKIDKNLLEKLISRKLVVERKVKFEFRGKEIAQISPEIIISGAWKKVPMRKYDITAPAPQIHPGKKQAYRKFLDGVKRELVALGFKEMEGPLVESCFYNCDALYMPQDHPARNIHGVYFAKTDKKGDLKKHSHFLKAVKQMHEKGGHGSKGWRINFSDELSRKMILRSHGTALSARTLMNNPDIPGKYFSIARCYRPDIVDPTHLTEFDHLEGIVLGKDVNFRQLLGLLTDFAKRIAGVDKVKFLPGYFPFTEPSVEGYIFHPKIKKWIEVLPAGIFRPELTKPLGIDVPVLAWGIGIQRLFMVKEDISDIRQLFSQDLDWLRNAKV